MTDSETHAGSQTASSVETAAETVHRVIDNVEQVIVGHHDEIEHVLVAMLAGGHVLLEDVPGVGKTMLSRAVATSFDGTFKRIQFTPDLLPADVTGVDVYNQQTSEFVFHEGPIFANVVLGDEINRAPPKTQSALLEAMEERQVTVDGTTRPVPTPFTVIATQNTVEQNRTYELPLAERDRFTSKLQLGYPDADEEVAMLDRIVGHHPIEDISPVVTLPEFQTARDTTAAVTVERPVQEYVTELATYTREHAQLGASPRASLSLLRAAQARALLAGRGYVTPDDVQVEAPVVWPHRIRTETGEQTPTGLVSDALEAVPVV
ncbi:AAA family ATPase [Halapricum hydrolyticum]|uniref:MoxR family ATPase n=1 Tax=Halapricum hydrolyticum TaxID=2979991 RepID=A0AAE3IA80_9EURY|nr:MoxR family ATPase [Halapricum hydrolyticum]MCU4718233.1 MoxR family ATPase [Halapricum hydrolyticum]MCU4726326.1 MoxR family ATPase [Halapricum hydrolyticum]